MEFGHRFNSTRNVAMAFNADQFGSGLGGFLGGLFGDSGAPYEKAMQQFTQFGNRAQQAQNPFLQAGTGAIPQFQQWLSGQQNPQGLFLRQIYLLRQSM